MTTTVKVATVEPGGGIDPRYCPPSIEGICDTCLRYSPYCLVSWAGVTRSLLCRKCRLL